MDGLGYRWMLCLWWGVQEQGYMSNPESIKTRKRFATISKDKCQPDLIKFMPWVTVWVCSSKKSNCSTYSELNMCSLIILSLGQSLFLTWHVFMAKPPGISSGSGPYMAPHPQVNTDRVISLSLKVNWDLCPVWRNSFRNLTALHSFCDVFFCACICKRRLPFIVYWKKFIRHCLCSVFVILLMKDAI